MPACVLICQTCEGLQAFYIHPDELVNLERGLLLEKDCPVCRSRTGWKFAFFERRSGLDRRKGADRRRGS